MSKGFGVDRHGVGIATSSGFGTGFHPVKLNPLLFLWRRGDLVTVTGSGVSTWTDIGSESKNATQGTDAQRPPFTNGELVFDGSDDDLTLGNIGVGENLQLNGVTATIIAFLTATNGDTRDDAMRIVDKSTGNNGTNGYCFAIRNDANGNFLYLGVGGAADISTTTVTDDELTMVGVEVANTTATFIKNGVKQDTAVVNAIGNAAANLKIGERASVAASNLDASVRGIMIYNTALTANQLLKIQSWGTSH